MADQEELVAMVFGDHPPEGWREDPDFRIYLDELGGLTPDRMVQEPERVAEELAGVEAATQELAASNYKTFIQTSSCTREVLARFTDTEAQLAALLEKLPQFREECRVFQARAGEVSSHRRLTSLTLARHTSLLEVLELPQLMETVVRNGHYEEALQLRAYVARLVKRQAGVAVLEDIGRAVAGSVSTMLHQLLHQLRQPLQLPQCLRVVSYLRRLDTFGEAELRLKFLQAREAWLESVVGVSGAQGDITKTMEVVRVHLFDIVTQYRAIFTDDDLGEGEAGCGHRLVFTGWLSRRVDKFLAQVVAALDGGTPPSEALLGQAMYFGLSFARVGFDFRPLLAPVFVSSVLRRFSSSLAPSSALSSLPGHLSSLHLPRLPAPAPPPRPDPATPPLALMDFPPLAHLANSVLGALNALRACAPVAACARVTREVEGLLVGAARAVADWQAAGCRSWGEPEERGFARLVQAIQILLLPHLQAALQAVFPPAHLAQVTGMSREQLASAGLGHLSSSSILLPLAAFLPSSLPSLPSPPPPEQEEVAESMEHLAAPLDSAGTKEEEGEDAEVEQDESEETKPQVDVEIRVEEATEPTVAEGEGEGEE